MSASRSLWGPSGAWELRSFGAGASRWRAVPFGGLEAAEVASFGASALRRRVRRPGGGAWSRGEGRKTRNPVRTASIHFEIRDPDRNQGNSGGDGHQLASPAGPRSLVERGSSNGLERASGFRGAPVLSDSAFVFTFGWGRVGGQPELRLRCSAVSHSGWAVPRDRSSSGSRCLLLGSTVRCRSANRFRTRFSLGALRVAHPTRVGYRIQWVLCRSPPMGTAVAFLRGRCSWTARPSGRVVLHGPSSASPLGEGRRCRADCAGVGVGSQVVASVVGCRLSVTWRFAPRGGSRVRELRQAQRFSALRGRAPSIPQGADGVASWPSRQRHTLGCEVRQGVEQWVREEISSEVESQTRWEATCSTGTSRSGSRACSFAKDNAGSAHAAPVLWSGRRSRVSK